MAALAAAIADAEGLEPRNVEEARRHTDWLRWNAAIREELEKLKVARTWTIIDKPDGVNVVGSKWVFKVKKDAVGQIERYHARLVVQ